MICFRKNKLKDQKKLDHQLACKLHMEMNARLKPRRSAPIKIATPEVPKRVDRRKSVATPKPKSTPRQTSTPNRKRKREDSVSDSMEMEIFLKNISMDHYTEYSNFLKR